MKKLSINTWLMIGLALGFVLGLGLNLAHVGPDGVRISEVSFGAQTFIEIANSQSSEVDLTDHRLLVDLPSGQTLVAFPPGTVLDYDGWTSNGEAVDGNAYWYKDLDGNYFWAGGTVVPTPGA